VIQELGAAVLPGRVQSPGGQRAGQPAARRDFSLMAKLTEVIEPKVTRSAPQKMIISGRVHPMPRGRDACNDIICFLQKQQYQLSETFVADI